MIITGILAWLLMRFGITAKMATEQEMLNVMKHGDVTSADIKQLRNSVFVRHFEEELNNYFPEYSLDSFPICILGSSSHKTIRGVHFSRTDINPFMSYFLKITLQNSQTLYFPSPEYYFYLKARVYSIPELALLAATMIGSDFFYKQNSGQLISKERLLGFTKGLKGRWKSKIIEALAIAPEKTESVQERALFALLSFPKKYGGYGLPQPETNPELPLSENAKQFLPNKQCVRPDLLYRKERLAIEYDSDAYHGNSKAIKHDKNRQCALETMGYTVIPVTKDTLYNPRSRLSLLNLVANYLNIDFYYVDGWEQKHRLLVRRALLNGPIF